MADWSSQPKMNTPTTITDKREALQRLWQTVYFSKDDPSFDTVAKGSKYADAYRSLIFQLHYAKVSKSISSSCWEFFVEEYMQQYSQAVDDQSGLNNFAEGALALAAHRKNESSTWKSSLSDMPIEKLMTFLPEGQVLKEDVNDVEVQQLIDILNTKEDLPNISVKSQTLEPKQSQQKFPNFPFPCWNEGNKQTLVHVPISLNSPFSSINCAQLAESRNASNSSAGPQSNLFQSTVSITLNSSHAGGVQKRKHVSSDNAFDQSTSSSVFRTARDQFAIQQYKKHNQPSTYESGSSRKCLGSRRGLNSKFISPILNKQDDDRGTDIGFNDAIDDRLKNIDPKMIEMITNEIMDHGSPVSWDEIAGLAFAKETIKESVEWPLKRPDLFRGLRGPAKGLLLFGPPGTGKTMIGKCIASQSKSTFFSISASSLTSKWIGDGEKMVRALFAVARCHQPAVVFIDEIDSLLSQRSESEHESSRRLKTEFLVQLDGATTCSDDRLLIVGATNRPQELDEAARRRLVKRLYIPLPEAEARKQIVRTLLNTDGQMLPEEDLETICELTKGYSGADMTNLCKEASLGPIRSISSQDIEHISTDQVRPIVLQDFLDAHKLVRASVSETDLETYLEWNRKYGSISA